MDVTIGSLTFDPVAVIDLARARMLAGWERGCLVGVAEMIAGEALEDSLKEHVGYCFIGATASALGVPDGELESADNDGSDLDRDVVRAIEFISGLPLENMHYLNDGAIFDEDGECRRTRPMATCWANVNDKLTERRAFFVAVAENVAAHKLDAQYDKLVSSLTEAATPELQRPKQMAE